MNTRNRNSRVLSLVTVLWALSAGFVTLAGNVGCDASALGSLVSDLGIDADTVAGLLDSLYESSGGCGQS